MRAFTSRWTTLLISVVSHCANVSGFSLLGRLFIWDIWDNWCDNACTLHITKSLMHQFRGHFRGTRKCSVNVDKLHKRPPLGTRWAGKEGWPEWTEKQTATSILCSQARMKSVCGWEPENPGWWKGDRPSAHKLFWSWLWPPVQGRGRTQHWPPKWPQDVAQAGSSTTRSSLPHSKSPPPPPSSYVQRPWDGQGTTVASGMTF